MIDWLDVAQSERALLFQSIKRVRDESGRSWEETLRDALGRLHFDVDGYVNNFRAGRNARRDCVRLFHWLRTTRPDLATSLERRIADLHGAWITGTWEKFVDEFGAYGSVTLRKGPVLPPPSRTRQEQHQIVVGWAPPPVQVGYRQLFAFDIDSPIAGLLIVLQKIDGDWRTFALTPAQIGEKIAVGLQTLPPPVAPAGVAQFYRGDEQGGLHRLAFLILPTPFGQCIASKLYRSWSVPPDLLDDIARAIRNLDRSEWRVLRLDVLLPAEPVSERGEPVDEPDQLK